MTRTGLGYDSHRFAPDRGGPLRLGGVSVPSDRSLIGHSDGDAIAHAITDAILGAAGAGDIGTMFPDTDPANRGRDSIEMLELAVVKVRLSRKSAAWIAPLRISMTTTSAGIDTSAAPLSTMNLSVIESLIRAGTA